MSKPVAPGFRLLLIALLVVLGVLQARLWLSEDGWSEVLRLRASVAEQAERNAVAAEQNERLGAEVQDLKEGFDALEERARAER